MLAAGCSGKRRLCCPFLRNKRGDRNLAGLQSVVENSAVGNRANRSRLWEQVLIDLCDADLYIATMNPRQYLDLA